MNKTLKLTTTSVLGTIIWSLLIILIVKVTESGYGNNDASKQLVAGITPAIVVFFLLKLIPTLHIVKDWSNLSSEQKSLTIWGLISADFIFVGLYFFLNWKHKKIFNIKKEKVEEKVEENASSKEKEVEKK